MSHRLHYLILLFYSSLLAWSIGYRHFNTLSEPTDPIITFQIAQPFALLSNPMMRDTIICEGEVIDGQPITEDGPLTITLSDGTQETIDIRVIKPIDLTKDTSICFGECFMNQQCEDGTFFETIPSSLGCDSLRITYAINVLDEIPVTELDTIFKCPGECYQGVNTICNTTSFLKIDEQTIPLTSTTGCDSMVHFVVIVEPDIPTRVNASICEGDVGYSIGNETFTTPGEHPVVLTSQFGCDSLVIVNLVQGAVSSRDTTIRLCEGETFQTPDGSTYDPRFTSYTSVNLVSPLGCDSIINYTLLSVDSVVIDTMLTICQGDTLSIGSLSFTENANQMFELPSSNAVCDSFISVNVTFIDCSLETTIVNDTVRCSDDLTGRFSFSIQKGFGPFSYKWTYLDSIITGPKIELGEAITAEGLPQGNYTITVTDNLENVEHYSITIDGPDYWDHEWETTDYNGYNVSCHAGNDGELTVFPIGNVPPYSYEWSNGESTQTVSNLSAGPYAVTIKDALNCSYIVGYDLTEPDPLQIEIDSIKPNCDSFATGVIKVVSETGGLAPYEHFIAGIGYGERGRFEGLLPGTYDLIVSDENGCSSVFETNLPAPDIPELDFDRQLYTDLADPVNLGILSNVPLATIDWSEEEGLDCYTCLSPIANPITTTSYTLTAISNDGCETTESITVNVRKKRDVFVPNIFSPNGDGLNDRLTIFGGPEVSNIQMMRIFSRWGELVYERESFLPNDPLIGWDGRFRGKKVASGTYIWISKIDFVDGESFDYSGEIVIK